MNLEKIGTQLLYSTIRLEAETPSGVSTGTGFVFSVERGEKTYPFVVTNKHVINGASVGSFFFTVKENDAPVVGKRHEVTIADFGSAWFGHPDPGVDISVMPLVPILEHMQAQGVEAYFKMVPESAIPTDEQLTDLDALEDIVFVGYPNGVYDAHNLLPIVRKGTTATPVFVDFNGDKVFLIDASVFPGSSGSPVMLVNEGWFTQGNTLQAGARFHFLGVIASVLIRLEQGAVEFVDIPTAQQQIATMQQMIDLGVVFKANTVLEACQGFMKSRGELD